MEDSRENRVCEGQYGEWMRAIVSKRGRSGGNGKNNVTKKVELQLNQIHSEGGNRGDRDEERGERENDQTGEMQNKIQETESKRTNNLLEEGKQV